VVENQHAQQSTRPTSQSANQNQVKLAYSTLTRSTRPQFVMQFVIAKEDERNEARQRKPAKEKPMKRAHPDE